MKLAAFVVAGVFFMAGTAEARTPPPWDKKPAKTWTAKTTPWWDVTVDQMVRTMVRAERTQA